MILPIRYRPFSTLHLSTFALLLLPLALHAQTANDQVPTYPGGFLLGVNPGYVPGFSDEQLANFATGNRELGIQGCGVQSLRPGLTEDFFEQWGYDSRLQTFQYFQNAGLRDHTVITGFPVAAHRDPNFYCPSHQSELFSGLYLPIWDGGANGTPVNEANHAAVYYWKMVTRYKPYVRFWEIWNEPGFDYTGLHGYLEPGAPGNWWDADPDPCDYKLRAPIQHYVRLLRVAYEVIKSIDPQAFVLCGGVGYPSFLDAILRNTDNPDGGKITPEFPLRGGAYFDAVGYHSYPHFDSSTREYNNSTGQFDYFRHSDGAAEGISVVKDRFEPVLKKWGYGGQFPEKIWLITEVNVPRREYPQFQMGGEELQRNFTIKAAVQCLKDSITAMHVYALEEAKTAERATFEFDQMGLYQKLRPNDGIWQTRNEAGIALKTTSEILAGKTFDPARTASLNLPANVGGGAFWDKNARRHTLVLWAKTAIDRSETAAAAVTLPLSSFEKWVRRDWDFARTRTAEVIAGNATVTLTATPVFFTEQTFVADKWSGCAPLTVQFGGSGFFQTNEIPLWQFQGGNPASATDVGTVNVTFAQPGDHQVTLQTIAFGSGNLLRTETWTIHVDAPPTANFAGEPAGGLVHFQNLSLPNADSFHWDFGDGTTSEEPNPAHVFHDDGSFTVTLTAKNECGNRSFSKTYAIDAPTTTNIGQTADEAIAPYNRPFRPGAVLRYVPGWTDEQLADIAAGNPLENQSGAGVRAGRFFLPQNFLEFWGYGIRAQTFEHYANLDLRDNVAVLGFPNEAVRETYPFCPTAQSFIFKNLYTDIWDGGANGTPVNEANLYALYIWKTVEQYRDQVQFWQVNDAPDYDASGKLGWLPPGQPGNWWEHDPEPCDLSLKAPVETYVRMLRIVYEIVQTLDSQAYVTIGGLGYPAFLDAILRNTDNPDGGQTHPRYPKTGGAYFDALGFNSYPFVDGSTSFYDPNVGGIAYQRHSDAAAAGIFSIKNRFDDVLKTHGFGLQKPAKKWLVSEANAPRKKFGDYFGGEEAQRNYLVKAMVEAMANGFLLFNVNNISEQAPENQAFGPNDAMGLHEFLGDKTPYQQVLTAGGKAFKTASTLLYPTIFDPVRTQLLALPTGVAGYAFRDAAGKFTYVLWAKTATDNSESANATYSFPTALAVGQLYRKRWDWSATGNQTTVAPTNIALTGSPVFLTETQQPPALPTAAFEADVTDGCEGLTVHFSDKSVGGQSRLWQFPGGSPSTSTAANPSVTYSTAGTYAVSLTATNAAGSHTASFSDFIEIKGRPTAAFSVTVDAQVAHFQSLSSGVDFVWWLLPDGTTTTEAAFDKFFFYNGDYPVMLVAFNGCGTDTVTQIVQIQAAPVADFSLALPSQCGQFFASVENLSGSSPTAVQWFIPGGNPAYSTENQLTATFPGAGEYAITLVVSNQFGTDTLTKNFTLTGASVSQLEPGICPDGTFELGGQIFSATNPTGEILIPGGSWLGCDSIVQVQIKLLSTSATTIYDTIPAGGSVQFCGNISLTTSGVYTCHLENAAGCDSTVTLFLQVSTSSKTPGDAAAWRVFPNPFSEKLAVEFDLANGQFLSLELCAATGQVLRQLVDNQFFAAGKHRLEMSLPGLPPGAYWLVGRGTGGQRAIGVLRM
ncbi:MAG: PKD domain-containing protein [Saprospiraceae bacterium]